MTPPVSSRLTQEPSFFGRLGFFFYPRCLYRTSCQTHLFRGYNIAHGLEGQAGLPQIPQLKRMYPAGIICTSQKNIHKKNRGSLSRRTLYSFRCGQRIHAGWNLSKRPARTTFSPLSTPWGSEAPCMRNPGYSTTPSIRRHAQTHAHTLPRHLSHVQYLLIYCCRPSPIQSNQPNMRHSRTAGWGRGVGLFPLSLSSSRPLSPCTGGIIVLQF